MILFLICRLLPPIVEAKEKEEHDSFSAKGRKLQDSVRAKGTVGEYENALDILLPFFYNN